MDLSDIYYEEGYKMFGFPTWLAAFLIAFILFVVGVWVLSFSGILFDDPDQKEKEDGGNKE